MWRMCTKMYFIFCTKFLDNRQQYHVEIRSRKYYSDILSIDLFKSSSKHNKNCNVFNFVHFLQSISCYSHSLWSFFPLYFLCTDNMQFEGRRVHSSQQTKSFAREFPSAQLKSWIQHLKYPITVLPWVGTCRKTFLPLQEVLVLFNCNLSFEQQITELVKTYFYHLRSAAKIRQLILQCTVYLILDSHAAQFTV